MKDYSLIILKNIEDKYLVYYDDEWKCWFFPNFKTDLANNTENIVSGISDMLGIDKKMLL